MHRAYRRERCLGLAPPHAATARVPVLAAAQLGYRRPGYAIVGQIVGQFVAEKIQVISISNQPDSRLTKLNWAIYRV